MKLTTTFYIKRMLTLSILLGCFISVNASTPTKNSLVKCEINGKIIDISSNKPLAGVNVFLEHTTVGAATNVNGEYRIILAPAGEHHLIASIIGYKTEHRIINIKAGESKTINFELQPTILEMGAIVVTGTATPHIYEDMPVKTEIIPRSIIEQKQVMNLAQALSLQTGVRVENNCTNCNFSQVRILGLDGKYSQILIDGDPVVSSLAGVYGLEHFPEEMIDQIEIVKGGGSSLYGGGSVAGIVNLITRRPLMNQVRLKFLGNSVAGSSDQHIGAVAEMVNYGGTSGAYVFGSFRKRNPMDYNDDGFSELGDLTNESIGFNWHYKPIKTGEVMADFHRIHEERRGGNKFDLPPHEADIAEWIEHWRWGGTVRWQHRPNPFFDYKFYYSFAIENRKSYYGGLHGDTPEDRLEALKFYGKTDNPLHISGAQLNYQLRGHLLTGGLQYTHDKLKDETSAETIYHIDDIYTDFGVFMQDDFYFLADKLEFVIGARMDRHSEINSWIFSPRINGKLNLGNGFTLRSAFTTGFKPPQTYDEDLHLCGVEGDQRVIRNSANLKEEKSNSISGGIDFHSNYNNIPIMFAIIGFYTKINNVFTEQFVSKEGVIERWERVNGEGAQVKGVEFDLGIRPISLLELRGGLTYKKNEYDKPLQDFGTKNFLRTPDIYGHLRFSLDMTSRINIFAIGNFTGKADVPHEIAIAGQEDPELVLKKSDNFFEIDLGLSYRLPLSNDIGAKFSIGIKNLTDSYQNDLDVGVNRDPAYFYGPTLPRTVYAGFETSF
jgi:outer membrane receptor for ferrienterochelin and colicins